jgi:hypothetical protein
MVWLFFFFRPPLRETNTAGVFLHVPKQFVQDKAGLPFPQIGTDYS